MTAMVELRNSQISTLKSQYKEIMKLDPFNLEKRYNKAKSERQELRKQVADLNQQLKKTIKDASERAWHLLIKKQRLPRWLMRMPNLRRSRRKCMALLSAVSLQATSSDVRANLLLPAPPGLWISSPKEFNNERPYIVSKLDFALSVLLRHGLCH